MLELAKLKKTDLLIDLGCGDGRIVVTAAKKYGVKAIGYDIDPKRVAEARENAKKSGVEDRVTIELKDIFTVDLAPANVVTLYLLPELNVKLIPQLDKLGPGSRIVSHDFDMEGVEPDKKLKLQARGSPGGPHDLSFQRAAQEGEQVSFRHSLTSRGAPPAGPGARRRSAESPTRAAAGCRRGSGAGACCLRQPVRPVD